MGGNRVLGPVSMEITSLGFRVTLPVESILACIHMRKKVHPFAQANSAHACAGCLALTELSRLGEAAKVYLWRKVGPARRVTRL